ncbi:hypothetical protein BDZ90DRAFT_46429 [Jaminaea rosea]|uniref:Uncharacterized protein n=1 Tax=Jaminaea rosea TaxID=1569628 RepID=A0A316ULN7_9BASI|nr:hypothetical protein BDZ90DRAFT_46429 [Jaminaea rosea]PWN26159.1 hypothetical protein BDZ90DRAFT_46429 [Jaminaea rosea]
MLGFIALHGVKSKALLSTAGVGKSVVETAFAHRRQLGARDHPRSRSMDSQHPRPFSLLLTSIQLVPIPRRAGPSLGTYHHASVEAALAATSSSSVLRLLRSPKPPAMMPSVSHWVSMERGTMCVCGYRCDSINLCRPEREGVAASPATPARRPCLLALARSLPFALHSSLAAPNGLAAPLGLARPSHTAACLCRRKLLLKLPDRLDNPGRDNSLAIDPFLLHSVSPLELLLAWNDPGPHCRSLALLLGEPSRRRHRRNSHDILELAG